MNSDSTDGKSKKDEAQRDPDGSYRQLFEHMADGAFIQLPDGSLKDCNSALLKMTGLTREEFFGRTPKDPHWNVIREDGTRLSWEELPSIRALSTQHPISDQVVGIFNPREKDYRWFTLNAIPLFDDGCPDLREVFVTLHDITAQRQAEEAMRLNEEKYRALYENAPQAYQSLNADGCFLDVNPGWLRMLGYERDEVIGQRFSDFLHPDWQPHFEKNFPNFKARGYVKDVQFKLRHKSGRYLDIELNGCIGYLPDGSFRQTYCVFQDITQRKLAQEQLLKSEETYRSLLNNLSVGVVVHASDTAVLFANPSACKALGLSQDQINGKEAMDPLWRFLREDGSAMPEEEYPVNQLRETGKPLYNLVLGVNRPDSGKVTWLLVNGFSSTTDSGECEQMVVSFADITQRKNATEMLEEERQRMAGILKGTNVGTWEWNVQTGNISINNRWAEMIGYAQEELEPVTFETWQNLCNPDDFVATNKLINKHFLGELDQYEMEMRLKHKDGSWIWILTSGRVIKRTEEGLPLMMMGTHQDITELHQMQERLRQTEKMDAIGQLAGGVAHDFNNQLTGILGYADMLASQLSDPTLLKYAQKIITASERSAELTAQLLAFGRKGKHLDEPVEIHRVIKDAISMLERSIDKRITLTQNLHANPATTRGDPTQLYNAFLNLGINARDAMPEAGELTYTTELVQLDAISIRQNQYNCAPGIYICISVADTGIGMSRETQRKAFEPFFTTKSQGKGTGLGLSSVYGTIKNHGGAINIYSELDNGSTFRVYLPLVTSKPVPHDTIEPAVAKGTGTILIVDDEPMLRELGNDLLRSLGYQTTACKDGQEAVEYYQGHWQEIDLVILDMIMPRMNGRDAFKAMHQINPEVRAILSSGYSINGKAQEILDDGVMAFVGKPFKRQELAATIAQIMTKDPD
jgi:PAS domain S-box-containing protein